MTDRLTPAMKQYMEIKNKHPDCLILFRMGDFYETFFEDAKLASKVLEITLTSRGNKTGPRIPLAGIPYHALNNYLGKLIKKGIKTAIVEQLEDPRQAKGVVKRDVVRIVTPGTVIEPHILDAKENNYIASIYFDKDYGLSFVDLSTGQFMTTITEDPFDDISRYSPAEILIPSMLDDEVINRLRKNSYNINQYEDRLFMFDFSQNLLTEHFKTQSLDGYGLRSKRNSICSSGALLKYLTDTQKNTLNHINKITFYENSEHMKIDKVTARNLELTRSIRDNSLDNTLLKTIDRTLTPMGARMLKSWMQAPLKSIDLIKKRQAAVMELSEKGMIRQELRILKEMSDIERLISKINMGMANPRDLLALKNSLSLIPVIRDILSDAISGVLKGISGIDEQKEIHDLIEMSIKEDPSVQYREGNIIKKGYDPEVDELGKIIKNSKNFIRDMERKEREKTGINNLKISFNRVFGYFFEVTKKNISLVPEDYIRKQTMANCERFITEELKELEEKILGAEEKKTALENELFQDIIRKISERTAEIQAIAGVIARLDCIFSFAETAVRFGYVKPEIIMNKDMMLRDARHPVIETIEEDFIPNDIQFNDRSRLMIITGPNMAGKSTLMRMVSLIAILGQMGSFVPAKEARLPIFDRIFSRVGAHDDITHGQSTFMVEMNEVAQILNNATEDSFIIMDEIGRGTSTYDGVAIAWAVAEHISKNIRCNTMFATHYHVLTKLSRYPGVKNFNIAVREEKDDIVFLRKMALGGTDKSYGIHVAKLAGMPGPVIEQARMVQFRLEDDDKIKDRIVVEKTNEKNGIVLRKSTQTSLLDMA